MLLLLGILTLMGVAAALLAYTQVATRLGASRERDRLGRLAMRDPSGFYLEVLNLQKDFLAGKLARAMARQP